MQHPGAVVPEPTESPPTNRLLTDAELELMHQLWDHGDATVRALVDAQPAGQERAYTTVATILQILREKGFVTAQKQGRAFVFAPAISREAYEARNLRQVVEDVFRGDAVSLVRRLVQAEQLDEDELAAMRALVQGLEP